MKIKIADLTDTASLVNFNQKMAMETEGKHLDENTLRKGVEAVFSDRSKGFYVTAVEGIEVIGGLMVTSEWSDWRNSWFWWIQSVYIVPEARGQGIYRSMYDFVKSMSKENGNVCGFRLYVERTNLAARAVYERVGMAHSHYSMYEENY